MTLDTKVIRKRAAGMMLPGVPGAVTSTPLFVPEHRIWSFAPYDPQSESDALFHAAARTDVPALCTALEEAWAEIARLTKIIQEKT